MQLNWRVYIEILWEGGDKVFDCWWADLELTIISLGAGDLGTDLWWDHEADGRLFRMSFVMATFFSGNHCFNPNLQSSWWKFSLFAPMNADLVSSPVLYRSFRSRWIPSSSLCCRIRPTPLQDKGLRDCCNSERPASSTPKNPFKCLLTVHCALCSQKESKTLKRMCCLQKQKSLRFFFFSGQILLTTRFWENFGIVLF